MHYLHFHNEFDSIRARIFASRRAGGSSRTDGSETEGASMLTTLRETSA